MRYYLLFLVIQLLPQLLKPPVRLHHKFRRAHHKQGLQERENQQGVQEWSVGTISLFFKREMAPNHFI